MAGSYGSLLLVCADTKRLIFVDVGTNNVNQFTVGNMDIMLLNTQMPNRQKQFTVINAQKEKFYAANWLSQGVHKIETADSETYRYQDKGYNKHSIKTKNFANKYGLNQEV